jgi:hypothetical protein
MKTKLAILAFALFTTGTLFGQPQEKQPSPDLGFAHGTWLCENAPAAVGFESDVRSTERMGVTLTRSTIDQIAKKQSRGYRCWYVQSDSLAVVEFYSLFGENAVRLSDGKNSGWAGDGTFLAYMKFHKVIAR